MIHAMGSACSTAQPADRRYLSVKSNVAANSEPDDIAAFPSAQWRTSQPPWKGHPRAAGRAPSRSDGASFRAKGDTTSEASEEDSLREPAATVLAVVAPTAALASEVQSESFKSIRPTFGKHGEVHDVKLSKGLTKLLRHRALEVGIAIDHDGWALVSDALRYVNSKESEFWASESLRASEPSPISTPASGSTFWEENDVREMARLNDKKRFELREGPSGLQIRVTEGAMTVHPKRRPSQMRATEMWAEYWSPGDDVALPIEMCGMLSCHGIDGMNDKINQDCASVAFPLPADAHTALFVVLDGHGRQGTDVAGKLLAELNERIGCKGWGGSERRLSRQLVEAFEGAHRSLFEGPRATPTEAAGGEAKCHELHGIESGACAVAVLFRNRRLLLAHVGDCRAVLGFLQEESGCLCELDLTKDHKLVDEEAERVRRCGGWIRPMREAPYFQPPRVYAKQDDPSAGPGLTMSRSLGDLDADPIGIISTPETSFRPLVPGRDLFVILASDGLWEFLSSATVVQVVGGFLERGEPAIQAARCLIAMASEAWRTEEGDYRDDVTAVVIYLDDVARQIEGSCNSSRPPSGSSTKMVGMIGR